ncbi:DUF2157 domain-containing protein [Phycicoccus duodecadis]|uniref:Putative membrane protein n=1 Tax=Phycicoccus duodecadis TaxID=173053 RepID=A0A2N3YK99_9MICO|nr:DUF2157 domain-containing protein [Phycicoccus duodecadis]PKW27270.1 putative membrane protein [Phycicoccus duodecadis]
MSAPPTTTSLPPVPDDGAGPELRHPATPAQLAWLEHQLGAWRAEGLVDDVAARAIRGRYVAHRRVTLVRIVLTLGALFVGLGLIWLVVANLDALSLALRLVLVVLLWVGLVVAAEALARRRARAGGVASPVVGAVRLLAAGAFGAAVFQAAQTLGLSLDDPTLVGVWALGALVHAYVWVAVGPTVLGVLLATFWLLSRWAEEDDDGSGVTLGVAAAALLAVAVGALHHRLPDHARRALAVPWREVGAGLGLGALFVAALRSGAPDRGTPASVWVVVAVALVVAVAGVLTGDRLDRLEVGLATAVLALVVVLALWRPSSGALRTGELTGGDWVRAVVTVVAYLAVASGTAVLGGLRDSDRLTWLATAALVVFTTTQAFAVFAPVLSGSVLFLAVGVVLLGTGVLADRGRRRVVREGRAARA